MSLRRKRFLISAAWFGAMVAMIFVVAYANANRGWVFDAASGCAWFLMFLFSCLGAGYLMSAVDTK